MDGQQFNFYFCHRGSEPTENLQARTNRGGAETKAAVLKEMEFSLSASPRQKNWFLPLCALSLCGKTAFAHGDIYPLAE